MRMLLDLRKIMTDQCKARLRERLYVVTVCCMKNTHFSLCVVFQSRYKSICLSVLSIILFLNKYIGLSPGKMERIPEEPCLLHWWCTPSRRQGRGVRTIGSHMRLLGKAIQKQLSIRLGGIKMLKCASRRRACLYWLFRNRIYLLDRCWLQLLRRIPFTRTLGLIFFFWIDGVWTKYAPHKRIRK